ncbi:MAG: hypothetical protein MMC33_001412 [Icmadophila ericetorum]|nr:hypothetical protein [Icmadophila ericetorum]
MFAASLPFRSRPPHSNVTTNDAPSSLIAPRPRPPLHSPRQSPHQSPGQKSSKVLLDRDASRNVFGEKKAATRGPKAIDKNKQKQKRYDRKQMLKAKNPPTEEQTVKQRFYTLKERYGKGLNVVCNDIAKLAGKLFCEHKITLEQYGSIMHVYSLNATRSKFFEMATRDERYDPMEPGRGLENLDEAHMRKWVVHAVEAVATEYEVTPEEEDEEEDEGDDAWLLKAMNSLNLS